jgi:type IV pilus assembly protein PilM
MLEFIQAIFAPSVHPIGVDFGSGTIRMAQVQAEGSDFKLHAAASADVPADVRDDPDARLGFFGRAVGDLFHNGNFAGRRAVLGLPCSVIHTHQLVIEQAEEKNLKQAVEERAKGKLPFDSANALLRYIAAGKASDAENSPLHIVVMAADSRWVNEYIATARKAGLNVVGMNMPQLALLDCFSTIYCRASDRHSVRMYVDLGASGTRISIAQVRRLLYSRSLSIGGDHLTAAVAEGLKTSLQNARTLRQKLGAGGAEHADQVNEICAAGIEDLAGEIDRCRTEHETVFPDLRVDYLIFVGGEARLEAMCIRIAERLKLPFEMGDSLRRMIRTSSAGIEATIDRRQPQPAWSVAVGLSLGPPYSE